MTYFTIPGGCIDRGTAQNGRYEYFPKGLRHQGQHPSVTLKRNWLVQVYVDDINLAGKKQNIHPMWKVLNKEVDVGEPTSFLDHVYLGCIQRQCGISKDVVDNYRTMFESRISAGAIGKIPCSENLRISSWSYDLEGHAKKCAERYCELANKTTQQLYKVSTPCIYDHHFKEEQLKSVGELSKVCSQIVLKCLNLARIGRPDILCSVNKFARSITKWTKACDKHHTSEYKQYCHVENTVKHCMCKKQTSVSHSSTESETISLDAGLRMDGIPALDLWDLIVAVFHGNTHQNDQVRGDPKNLQSERNSWKD